MLSKGVDMWRFDIRDFYHAANAHLDAAVVLLRGVNKFRETSPPIDELIDTSRLMAEFLTRQGRIQESINIFHALLSQGQQKECTVMYTGPAAATCCTQSAVARSSSSILHLTATGTAA